MRTRLLIALSTLITPLILLVGIYLGGHSWLLPGGVRDLLVADEASRTLDQSYDLIEQNYYRKIDRKQLIDSSLDGAVKSLNDRFSSYYTASEYQRFRDDFNSQFSGIGVSVTVDPRGLKIIDVFADSPAKSVKLTKDDLIVEINGRSIKGKATNVSVPLLRGKEGTTVNLTVLSGKRKRTLKIKRKKIKVPAVKSQLKRVDGRKVGVTRLSGFTVGSAKELRQATERLIKRGADRLVLDLRGNGGGLVSESVDIASIYLDEGLTVVTTKGRNRPSQTLKAKGDQIDQKIPMVVLVDRNSASASEIVTGALGDHRRATVIGETTFGKGVFQEITELANGGALDITVGQYFTPKGKNLGGSGVKRGAGIKPSIRAVDRQKTAKDEALERALAVIGRSSQ